MFRFLHTPENPVCCQPLLVLQSACASASTHCCSHSVLKSLSADHRAQNMIWHHCWKLSLQVCDIPSRQQGQTCGTSVTCVLAQPSLPHECSWPGLTGGGLGLPGTAGHSWEYGAGSGLPNVIRFAAPSWRRGKVTGLWDWQLLQKKMPHSHEHPSTACRGNPHPL